MVNNWLEISPNVKRTLLVNVPTYDEYIDIIRASMIHKEVKREKFPGTVLREIYLRDDVFKIVNAIERDKYKYMKKIKLKKFDKMQVLYNIFLVVYDHVLIYDLADLADKRGVDYV